MKSLSSKTYQCGVTIQGLTTLSGTVYLTGITNTASWDHVIVGTTAQGQIYTRTYAQFMGDVATGISLSSYVTGSGTTNYLPKFTGASALGNSQIFDNGTSVGIGTNSPVTKLNLKESNTGTEGLIITNWNNVNTLFLGSDSSSGGGKITLKTNAGTSNVFISSYSDSYLNGGNVGIGTTSPIGILHLYKSAAATRLAIDGDAGQNRLISYRTGAVQRFGLYVNNTAESGSNAGSNFAVRAYSDAGTLLSTPLFIERSSGNVGIGTTSPQYKLDVNGTLRTNDRAYIGEDVTFTSAQYYYLISPSADGQVTFTNSTVTNGQAQGFFGGELSLAGTQPYINHRAINIVTTVRNTSTSNIAVAFYASGRTGNTGAANKVAGFLGGVNIEGSGNVTNAIGLEVEILSQTNNKTITNMYGVKVQPLINSVGTITNTYGLYIDSLTAGTQTNAAYGIYQAGTDKNYFGGNVGIGTSSPSTKLHISTIGNTDGLVQLLNGDSNYGATTRYSRGGNYNWDIGVGASASNNIPFSYFGIADGGVTPRLVIAHTTGYVGIGTTSPGYKLDVVSSDSLIARFNGSAVVSNSATEIDILGPQSNGELNVGVGGSTLSNSTNNIQNKGFITAGSGLDGLNLRSDQGYVQITAGGITSANEVARFTAAGNVGIGTTSPGAKLDVNGAQIIQSAAGFGTDADQAALFLSNTANFGLSGNFSGYSRNLIKSDGGSILTVGRWNTSLIGELSIESGSSGLIKFLAGASERMRITSTGNVGIGTTSPVSHSPSRRTIVVADTTNGANIEIWGNGGGGKSILQSVNGDTYVGNLANGSTGSGTTYITSGNGSTYTTFLANGNIGIGTTAPTNRLQIGSIGSSGYGGNDLAIGNGTQVMAFYQSATVSTWYTNTSFSLMPSGSGSVGYVGIGTLTPSTLLDVSGVITATGGNSTNWNTAYGWGNHASASYVPQARTLTINGTSYDLSANRSWTISTTTPGGSDTQVQYNSSGSLAGASALTYNSTTNRVGINQASPGYDLDVNGQVRVQDKLRVGTGNGVVHMSSTATINASATTVVWAQTVSVGMCAFIEYYILNSNSLTDQRAGTIMVTWNQSGTPTIAHTETTTPDIGSTTTVNFTSSLVGSDARINAVNSSANPYTMVMSYKYF